MNQNVYDNDLKYQELLIMAYFRTHYKKYEFSEIVQMMGMTYSDMRNSIEHLLELKYLLCIENNIVLSIIGEKILEKKEFTNFFGYGSKEKCQREQMSIDEPYIPFRFEM